MLFFVRHSERADTVEESKLDEWTKSLDYPEHDPGITNDGKILAHKTGFQVAAYIHKYNDGEYLECMENEE